MLSFATTLASAGTVKKPWKWGFDEFAHEEGGVCVGLEALGVEMLPLLPSMDTRGWQEMNPLNGPAWSLFFEYVANILYALGPRKLSNKLLGGLRFSLRLLPGAVSGLRPSGDAIGGWSIDRVQLHIGFARLLYPFFGGMLLERLGRRIHVKGASAVCSVLLVGALALPRLGGPQHLWMNGLYESFCILILFTGDCGDGRWRGACGRGLEPDLQVPGRHLLPAVYHALSADLRVYGVGGG